MWAEEPETPEEWMMRKERLCGAVRCEHNGRHVGMRLSIIEALASGRELEDVANEWGVPLRDVEAQCNLMTRRLNGQMPCPSTSVAPSVPTRHLPIRRRFAYDWTGVRVASGIPREMSDDEIKRAFA